VHHFADLTTEWKGGQDWQVDRVASGSRLD
jgi:hypothetical protein